MKTKCYVALGGNVGDTASYFDRALDLLASLRSTRQLKCSSYYQTTPVGPPDQEDYLNAVCFFRTSLSLKELHQALQKIESELGKTRKGKFDPRLIDLDLLFYGSEACDEPALTVPHPGWDDRLFVLAPLAEIADDVAVPRHGSIENIVLRELLQTFPNRHNEIVKPVMQPANPKVRV